MNNSNSSSSDNKFGFRFFISDVAVTNVKVRGSVIRRIKPSEKENPLRFFLRVAVIRLALLYGDLAVLYNRVLI
jgi:hypothetical protein